MNTDSDDKGFWRSPVGVALCVFAAVAGLLLVLEHRVHLTGALPLLLLLLCAGMHFFMHGGHGSNRHDDHGGGKGSDHGW